MNSEYYVNCHDGKGIFRFCKLFEGMDIIYQDISAKSLLDRIDIGNSRLIIECCFQGSAVYYTKGGNVIYLNEGDVLFSRNIGFYEKKTFPHEIYQGIYLIIQSQKLYEMFAGSGIEEDIENSIKDLIEKAAASHDGAVVVNDSTIRNLISDIENKVSKKENNDDSIVKLDFLKLVFLLDNKSGMNDSSYKECNSSSREDIAVKTRKYIAENYKEDILVRDIADKFFVSEAGLRQHYQTAFGTTIASDIRKLRMNFACSLLLTSSLNIADIANRSGYKSASKFAVTFKKYIGMSPHDFRKRSLAEKSSNLGNGPDIMKSELICILDPDGKIISANNGLCELSGTAKEYMLGMHLCEFVVEDDRKELNVKISNAGRKDVVEEISLRILSKKRSEKYVQLIIKGVFSESGNLMSYQCMGRIMQNEGKKRTIKVDAENVYSMIEQLPGNAYITSIDYTVIYANEIYKKIYGDIIGKKCYELLWGRDDPCEECKIKTVFTENKVAQWECVYNNGDVDQVFCFPLEDPDGNIVTLQLFVGDEKYYKARTNVAHCNKPEHDKEF